MVNVMRRILLMLFCAIITTPALSQFQTPEVVRDADVPSYMKNTLTLPGTEEEVPEDGATEVTPPYHDDEAPPLPETQPQTDGDNGYAPTEEAPAAEDTDVVPVPAETVPPQEIGSEPPIDPRAVISEGIPAPLKEGALAEERNKPAPMVYHEEDFTNMARLQILNKVTARASTLDIPLNKGVRSGNLEIFLLKCWRAPAEEEPEHKALLKIWEQVPGEPKRNIFEGWMFASSPALSALEHPVYDITVLQCMESSGERAAEKASKAEPEPEAEKEEAPKKAESE